MVTCLLASSLFFLPTPFLYVGSFIFNVTNLIKGIINVVFVLIVLILGSIAKLF